MALPANSPDHSQDQQVMLAQVAGSGTLEGETAGPDYRGQQGLPNGVPPPDPSPASLESLQWGSPVLSQEPRREAEQLAAAATLEQPVQSPPMGFGTFSQSNRGGAGSGQQGPEWPRLSAGWAV